MGRRYFNPDVGYYEEDYDDGESDFDGDLDSDFADPQGPSALRAASEDNPRDRPCPTCGWPDRLTRRDVALGYQCDSCANALERGGEIDYYGE